MSIRQEDFISINEEIWASMLGLTIVVTDATDILTESDGSIAACVQLVGAWNGAIRLDCTFPLARLAAEWFLGKPGSSASIEEVRDTVGELANMAAGRVKALLPQPTHISLPAVADGSRYDVTVRKGRLLLQCPFECRGQGLLVTLIERTPSATDALLMDSLGIPLTASVH
jgi:chemotaxis protein CheX